MPAAKRRHEVAQPDSETAKARDPTTYEARVYALCKAIPRGSVTTYGAMATVLGSSARAVGQAMRRNPFAPVVPCHRVIASSLQLGGFNGSWGSACGDVQRKKALLIEEGVSFTADKVASTQVVLGVDALAALVQGGGAGASDGGDAATPPRGVAAPARKRQV